MKVQIWALLGSLLVAAVSSLPQVSQTPSWVYVTESSKEGHKESGPILPKIYEMRVDTNITNRFAHTQVTSKVKNLEKSAQEATFSVVIPERAFISGFVMEIDGKSYEAYIQEKEQAKATYNKAVASGQGAAHVAVNARDSNRFTVSVNVEPQTKAVFILKYDELLQRQNDQYELVLNIQPGQPVKKLEVAVHIDESRPLKFVKAPSLRSGNEISKDDDKLNPNAQINIVNKTSAVVKFSPDIEKQKQYASGLGTKEEYGLAGQFIVQYDVESDPQGGEVLIDNGYFVHFFAPSDLPSLPKFVVFILDTSASMDGTRIKQLKEAMRSILPELKKDDVFNIVEFGTIVKIWNIEETAVQYESGIDRWSYYQQKREERFENRTHQSFPPAYPATEENIGKAKLVIDKLSADAGSTDIQSALKVGIELVDKNIQPGKKRQPIIVFLTDGQPTDGELDNDKIIKTVSELDAEKYPIFSLSFGDDADRSFLQKLSLKNMGFARHIYEAADASLQLQEFYKEISSPLLSHVTFKYVSNVSEVTTTYFPIFFRGSEIVVCGKIDPGFSPPAVDGWNTDGPVKLIPVVRNSVTNLEKHWAYITLRQLLERREAAENKTNLTQDALKIALKYSFVSDVSSLVVVKPNASDTVETKDASKKEKISANYPTLSGKSYLPLYKSQLAFDDDVDSESVDLRFDYEALNSVSSTVVSLPPPTTSTRTLTDIELIESKLHWLSSVLNDNGTITINSGNFKLGLNETISSKPACPTTPLNDLGICTLIHKCPKIHQQLTDFQVYKRYFCDLNGFAGVCCPPEDEPTT